MDEDSWPITGRSPFAADRPDNNFSGMTVMDTHLEGDLLEKSFFRGSNLESCSFTTVKINNTEFAEARIDRCLFETSDLSGSDFIDTIVRNTSFVNCTFEEGEWRASSFECCTFTNCMFTHTTLTLCEFTGCTIDQPTITTMLHPAINYNAFSGCRFAGIGDVAFATRNFGVAIHSSVTAPISYDAAPATLEVTCLLNNLGQLHASFIPKLARNVCDALLSEEGRRVSPMVFLSMIVKAMTAERRLSGTTLLVIRDVLMNAARDVQSRFVLNAIMDAILGINSSLLAISDESASLRRASAAGDEISSIEVRFGSTFTRDHAAALLGVLNLGRSADALSIAEFRTGSTFIAYACSATLSVGALLGSLNFVLRQATITIEHIDHLERSVSQLLKRKRRSSRTRNRSAMARRHESYSLLTTPERIRPELQKLCDQVSLNGEKLSDLDEPVEVRALVEHTN